MNLSSFLQEDNGKFSATRLALLVWSIGLLGVWAAGSIYNVFWGSTHNFLELPPSTITLVGLLMAGKVVQKYEEKPTTETPPQGTTPLPTVKEQTKGSTQTASAVA